MSVDLYNPNNYTDKQYGYQNLEVAKSFAKHVATVLKSYKQDVNTCKVNAFVCDSSSTFLTAFVKQELGNSDVRLIRFVKGEHYHLRDYITQPDINIFVDDYVSDSARATSSLLKCLNTVHQDFVGSSNPLYCFYLSTYAYYVKLNLNVNEHLQENVMFNSASFSDNSSLNKFIFDKPRTVFW